MTLQLKQDEFCKIQTFFI